MCNNEKEKIVEKKAKKLKDVKSKCYFDMLNLPIQIGL